MEPAEKTIAPPAGAERSGSSEWEPTSFLGPDGTLTGSPDRTLSDDGLVEAYRRMLASRTFDERAFSLQRQGRLGTFSTVQGQEASVVGSAMALDPKRDWVVPQYRELPAMLRQGYSLERFLRYFMGDPSGGLMPEGVNVLPFQIALAAQVPHAVGLGWGLRSQGRDSVVITYFGDGASSEGDVHEAMNFAGVLRAPVIFFLQNNGYAISTPVSLQTAGSTFAARAEGYGFPGLLVDGNDLLAVYEATAWAVERARCGEGPTLIESRTYRLGPHNTADDATRYVDPAELEDATGRDPLRRLRRHLESRGLIDDASEKQMLAEIKVEIAAAIAAAEGGARPGAAQLFDHVYAEAPSRVSAQRQAWTEEPA